MNIEKMGELKHILGNLEMIHRCNITSNLNSDLKTDYSQGLVSGMGIANEFYTKHIQELRTLVNSLEKKNLYMIEDVNLDGGQDVAI